MSHSIDTDGIREKLIVLEHACYGSHAYCAARGVGSNEDQGVGELDEYWGWLKAIVSNYTIECAVKLRMIEEYCAKNSDVEQYREALAAAKISRLGYVRLGDFELTLRECSNKIIHATRTELSMVKGNAAGREIQYWDGLYQLHGSRGHETWHIEFNVANWCSSTLRFLDELDGREMILYMGQDWS